MRTSSMLARQISGGGGGGRGHIGARKLIPIPLRISCAPHWPPECSQTIPQKTATIGRGFMPHPARSRYTFHDDQRPDSTSRG